MNDGPPSASDSFVRDVLLAEDLESRAQSLVHSLGGASPWVEAARKIEFGEDALGGATTYLSAATNSMRALELLTIQSVKANELDQSVAVLANITLNGTAGLLRQVLECAVTARWILGADHRSEVTSRGFAAVWENASEALKHARSVSSANLPMIEGATEELVNDGRRLRLLVPDERRKPPWRPQKPIPDATGLLRASRVPTASEEALTAAFGPGAVRGEWVYRWLSGMAHGLSWVHPRSEPSPSAGASGLVAFEPDYTRLALSSGLAISLIRQVLVQLESEPGPAWRS